MAAAILGMAGVFIRELLRRDAEDLAPVREDFSPIRTSPPSEPSSQASGSNNRGRTKQQLYEEAQRLNVKGRSKMSKEELERALEAARSSG